MKNIFIKILFKKQNYIIKLNLVNCKVMEKLYITKKILNKKIK